MQLVQDLRTLRALAEYLLRFDAVTFLMYLENLRATEGVTSVWLFHDAAHTIFEQVTTQDCAPRGMAVVTVSLQQLSKMTMA